MSTHPVELFCSYANADESLYLELERHLSPLYREGVISCRHKRQIIAGMDWTRALDEQLNTASVILLFVSSDFVASDYCYGTEMQRAMERYEAGDAHVIPILLRPVDWQNAPFGKLQALPSSGKPITQWRNRDAAFADVAQSIREVLGNTPIVASTPSATFRHSSLSPHSSDPPPPTLPRKQNEFNSIYLLRIIEEKGAATPETNSRSLMEFLHNPLRSLIRALVHLKIAPRQAHWHEETVKRQKYDGTRRITVWLATEGDVTYVVDSVTISHRKWRGPIALSGRSGAMLPDAQYSFPIIADSTKTYALSPALVLSHEDRREVSFSLSLSLQKNEEPLSSGDLVGPVNIALHYHAFDGTQGKLYLASIPEDGTVLSRLLKADIEMNGLIICPKGCQRGVDENGESEQIREIFSYKPLMSPDDQIFEYHCSKNDTHHITQEEFLPYLGSDDVSFLFSLTPERQTLNKAIEEKGILPHIQNLLIKAKDVEEPRTSLLFNLCAGHPHASCEQTLIQIGMSEIGVASDESHVQTNFHEQIKTEEILESVVDALAIRHMLQPSEMLADFILRLPYTRLLRRVTRSAFVALVIRRKGKWLQALIALYKSGDSLISNGLLQVLLSRRGNLTNEERHIADEFAQEQFEQFLKLDTLDCWRIYDESIESAIKYLLQIGSPCLGIRQKLLAMESALLHMRDYIQLGGSEVVGKDTLKRWIKSLRDLTD